MKGIRFQLKNILKDKFCLMTFLLPIIAAAGLNFMGSIDLSDMGRFYFGIVENDLPAETAAWLGQYGSVTICDTDEALIAAVKEPSTNVIGVKSDGTEIRTLIAGDELELYQKTASTLPALYRQRAGSSQVKARILKSPDSMAGLQDFFIPVILIVAMFMGCTFNAMNIISEKEDGIAFINEILPMTAGQYMIQKILVGFLCSALSSLVTACICFHLSWQNVWVMFALIFLSSFVASLIGLFIGKLSDGLMVGAVYIKIVMILFIAVPVLSLILAPAGPLAVLCYIVPSQPTFEGILGLTAGNMGVVLKDVGILCIHSAAWFLLYILFNSKTLHKK